jgi:DNA-binding GntR family transcriptional regulator
MDERLLAACVEHDPDAAAQALFEHLELASLFFETELGGKGIFSRD